MDAFSATVYNGAIGINTFNDKFTSNGSSFDGTTMSILTNGLYWMHISVTAPANTSVYVTLSGITNSVKIIQNHNGFTKPDTISRNNVMNIQAGSLLTFLSQFPSLSLQWTTFRVDNCFSPLIIFQVARSTSASGGGLITYDVVLTNIGLAWNHNINTFIAPLNGLYFFSLSAGMNGNQVFGLQFNVNGIVLQQTQAGSASLFAQGNDLYSVSKLLALNASDYFTTSFFDGDIYSNSTDLQISLAGFYYSPAISSQVIN